MFFDGQSKLAITSRKHSGHCAVIWCAAAKVLKYCAMKLLPYQDEAFSEYRTESVQEFRFVLSEQIRQQVFYAIFMGKAEISIKSNALINALKQLIQRQGYHL